MKKKRFNTSGMGLLSLLIVIAIIGLIYYSAMKAGQKSGKAKDGYYKQTAMDASNARRTIDHTKSLINDAVATQHKHSEGFEGQ